MSWLEQYRALAQYNALMNHKLYAVAATLSDAERRRDRGAFFRSIHGTLNHLLLADRVWLLRFTGDEARYVSRDENGSAILVTSLDQELYGDFATLTRERERTDADILAWMHALDDAALAHTIEYRTINGAVVKHVAWWAIGHLFNHQTHHRGQVTTLLTQSGVQFGSTDLIAMLRDETRFAAV